MQPLTAPPREDLTEQQVRDLITGDEVDIEIGLELLDAGNRYVADLSDDLVGGRVFYDGLDTVPGKCSLQIQRPLAWGRDRVRVFMSLSNAAVSARFNLGVYVLTTPKTPRGETPATFDVQGYDLIQELLDPVGDTYVVLPEAGVDLVTNPGFETDATGWGSYEPFPVPDFTAATFIRTTAKSYGTGVASVEMTWPTTGAGISWLNTDYELEFVVGKTYKFTAAVWIPTGGPSSLFFDVLFTEQSPHFFPATDGWVEVEWLWTATVPRAYVALSFRGTTAGQKTWIDEFHVTGQSTTCLDAVATVIEMAGGGAPLRIDGTQQVAVLPGPMVWALTESNQATWLDVCNDLLAAVGYDPLWVDQDGNYRSEPFVKPAERPVEWVFDLGDEKTNLVGPDGDSEQDVWGKPNRWRGIRRGMAVQPVEGDGIYTVDNPTTGPSSIASMGGKIRRRTEYLDAVDQAALVAQVERIKAEDMAATRTINLMVDPLPIAGHLDVVGFVNGDDAAVAEVTSWEIPLDGSLGRWVLEVAL